MRILMAAAIMASLARGGQATAADRLIEESRFGGQSDSHTECTAKLLHFAAVTVATAPSRLEAHASEDTQIVALAKPRAISMIIEFWKSDTEKWNRIAVSCEEETFVRRSYVIDHPTPIEPPAPMREVLTHILQTYPSQDECVADLVSIALISLGATDIQEKSNENRSDEMRLIFKGGVTGTEMRRRDNAGIWATTTTSCVSGRETVVHRSAAANPPRS